LDKVLDGDVEAGGCGYWISISLMHAIVTARSQNPRRMLRNALIAVKTRIHHHGMRAVPVEYYGVMIRANVDGKDKLTLQPIPTAIEPTKRAPYHHWGTSRYFFISVYSTLRDRVRV
jgi:hypothetical protein